MTELRHAPRVWILYEDSRAIAGAGFALHDFVLANIRDATSDRGGPTDWYRLVNLVAANPKNSDTKVLRALEEDAERLHAGRSVLVAWLDDDKLHKALKLPGNQPSAVLESAIRKRVHAAVPADAVRIHLLRGNVEQLLRRLDAVQPGTFDAATLEEALDKVPASRDRCFKSAARDAHAGWRKLIRDGDPSFAELINYLADLVTRETWPPW